MVTTCNKGSALLIHFKVIVDYKYNVIWASQVARVVKNLPANAGDVRDAGLLPGLARYPGGEHGNPLQYSCLENSKERTA